MKLALGTAQFGMAYGISNCHGQIGHDEIEEILDLAKRAGIRKIDTARAYGVAESVLGKCKVSEKGFKIITKIPSFTDISDGSAIEKFIKQSLRHSLSNLRSPKCYGVLLHDQRSLLSRYGENVFAALQELKQDGLVEKVGVSVYERLSLEDVLEHYKIDLVQVPGNILDRRFLNTELLRELKGRGVEIHLRSIFLQGLLLMPVEDLKSNFQPYRRHLSSLRAAISEAGLSPLEACVQFVEQFPEVDAVIVGISCKRDLKEIIAAANLLNRGERFDQFISTDEKLINPKVWPVD